MNLRGDDVGEMTTAADDAADELAFEAFLAGRTMPSGADDGTVAFAGAVRATATQPGRPNAALAELLATGLLIDQSSPSIRTALSAGSSPRRSRVRRRRRFAMFFPALLAKFLSAGAVAQAASGVGIALVAFTGAGATGLLGDNVQTTLTSVVGAADETTGDVTPEASPSPEETETPAVKTPAVETPAPDVAEFDAEAWALNGPVGSETFGEWVSRGAHNKDAFEAAAAVQGAEGKTFGSMVSEWARKKHVDLSEVQGIEDVEGIDDSAASATPTPEAETETEHSTEATHGNGGGNSGHGGGNSGRGHN
jgi:hypothetical protein